MFEGLLVLCSNKVGRCQHVGRVAGSYSCQSECLRQCIFKVDGSCFRHLSSNVLRGNLLVGPILHAEHPELVLQTKDLGGLRINKETGNKINYNSATRTLPREDAHNGSKPIKWRHTQKLDQNYKNRK